MMFKIISLDAESSLKKEALLEPGELNNPVDDINDPIYTVNSTKGDWKDSSGKSLSKKEKKNLTKSLKNQPLLCVDFHNDLYRTEEGRLLEIPKEDLKEVKIKDEIPASTIKYCRWDHSWTGTQQVSVLHTGKTRSLVVHVSPSQKKPVARNQICFWVENTLLSTNEEEVKPASKPTGLTDVRKLLDQSCKTPIFRANGTLTVKQSKTEQTEEQHLETSLFKVSKEPVRGVNISRALRSFIFELELCHTVEILDPKNTLAALDRDFKDWLSSKCKPNESIGAFLKRIKAYSIDPSTNKVIFTLNTLFREYAQTISKNDRFKSRVLIFEKTEDTIFSKISPHDLLAVYHEFAIETGILDKDFDTDSMDDRRADRIAFAKLTLLLNYQKLNERYTFLRAMADFRQLFKDDIATLQAIAEEHSEERFHELLEIISEKHPDMANEQVIKIAAQVVLDTIIKKHEEFTWADIGDLRFPEGLKSLWRDSEEYIQEGKKSVKDKKSIFDWVREQRAEKIRELITTELFYLILEDEDQSLEEMVKEALSEVIETDEDTTQEDIERSLDLYAKYRAFFRFLIQLDQSKRGIVRRTDKESFA